MSNEHTGATLVGTSVDTVTSPTAVPDLPASLPSMLADQAQARPLDIAVVSEQISLTFADLLHQAEMLADHIDSILPARAQPGLVGVYVEPSVELMVGAWGVLVSGRAYVPLSPDYPDERLRYIIDDAQLSVIVTQEHLRARLRDLVHPDTRIITLRDCGNEAGNRSRHVAPDALAYVIYTSGSTGHPKGVMIEHRSVVNQMKWLSARHGIGAETVVLQKTPMSFDAAQWEILAPSCGSQVVMGEAGCHRDPERLLHLVRRYGVTALQCVPTLLAVLLASDELADVPLEAVFCGGEALSRSLASDFFTKLPGRTLVNLYGPTECTINTSSHIVDRADVAQDKGSGTITIGRPASATKYRIVDTTGLPVVGSAVGELHIGGVQVARGYLRRPELTADRFVDGGRWFRTGDLAHWNIDGTVQFVGRADNQVKVRGHRIELDEVRLAVEAHDWVRTAGVVVRNDPRTGFASLVAGVELNPQQAALMDQGDPSSHHQSKASRLQVRAQLAAPGLRDRDNLSGRFITELAVRDGGRHQRAQAFRRKTYRFYEGGGVKAADLIAVLGRRPATRPQPAVAPTPEDLGDVLRHLGAHTSPERLLPKYAYASPGSLYATQVYVEIGTDGPGPAGIHYYHPVDHRLFEITRSTTVEAGGLRIHLLGRTSSVASVYRTNIDEVLAIEAGHITGLLDEVLVDHGLSITVTEPEPHLGAALRTAADDRLICSLLVTRATAEPTSEDVDLYVQAHPGGVADLPTGQYRYRDGTLEPFSENLVLRRHVVAINQSAYDRAGFAVTAVSRGDKSAALRYVALGRTMQRLMMNDRRLGFMSAGYSSECGHDLPAARRVTDILSRRGAPGTPCYFFIGGRVSKEQWRSEGMKEDLVHMKGPAELVRDDLAATLPDYMVPGKVVVLDRLPLTPNGKVDLPALARLDQTTVGRPDKPIVPPCTAAEQTVAKLWRSLLRCDELSVDDDFFASGGNSLFAVAMVNGLNRLLGCTLPAQALFESPTIRALAARTLAADQRAGSRLVPLTAGRTGRPVFCWPGLGGYPMNLRVFSDAVPTDRPFRGVQTQGVNAGEPLSESIDEMAAADLAALREVQPRGPYTLWGYSFGARLAFETACLLEQSGEVVDQLFLVAPGSPRIQEAGPTDVADYGSKAFVTVMFSVFAGRIDHVALATCLADVKDEASFVAHVCATFPSLPPNLVARIVRIVTKTYGFRSQPMSRQRLTAPVTVIRARGDESSFIELRRGRWSFKSLEAIDLTDDHYAVLREPGVHRLAELIGSRLPADAATPAPLAPPGATRAARSGSSRHAA